jgi:ABC-type nitrate/sulfonate/bicarbonate transport system substrate-binding protein
MPNATTRTLRSPVQRVAPMIAVAGLVALLLAVIAPLPVSADEHRRGGPTRVDTTPAEINFGVFFVSLPMLAAQAEGFWERHNLTVNYLGVTGSRQQFDFLRSGQYDIVQTSPDNVMNYRYNSDNALGEQIPAQMFIGFDYGLNLRIVAGPDIAELSDLRGKDVAVDAPDSGFAYVIYEILRGVGLEAGEDYNLVEAGGVGARFRSLLAGEFDATLLCCGLAEPALHAGLSWPEGGLAQDTIEPYHGVTGAALESWLQENPDVARRFVQAYYEATQWAFDPANRERAIQLIMGAQGLGEEAAEEIYELSLDPRIGNLPDASIDRKAIYNMLVLREQFDGFEQEMNLRRIASPQSGLYDLSYYRAALRDHRRGF